MKNILLYSIWFCKQIIQKINYLLDNSASKFPIEEIQNRIENDTLFTGLSIEEKKGWEERLQNTLSCDDNLKITKVPNAGIFEGRYLIMHNGIKIDPLSYYGFPALKVLIENKGIHEPQEEFIFQEVLKDLPDNSVMIELGSYWAFYSMWFCKKIKGGKSFMVEPEYKNLRLGKFNFKINNLEGVFFQSFVSDKFMLSKTGDRYISVDYLVRLKKIEFVHLLHCDIQGFENRMLDGAIKLFESKKLGYIFISTHSNDKHTKCLEFLKKYNFIIVSEANLNESYSVDGVIVAKAPYFKGIETIEISKK